MDKQLDDFFSGLSTDPQMASFELLQRVNSFVLKGSPGEIEYTAACGIIEAYYDASGWKPPERINPGGYSGGADAVDIAIHRSRSNARLQYEAYQTQIMVNYKLVMKKQAAEAISGLTASTYGYAVLDPAEKKDIQIHIEKIRSIIEGSQLADGKKNALFDRLSDLTSEVNRNGTRTDRFFAFASEFAFCARDFAKDAKPMFDEVKDILKIVTRARARHDGLKLPLNDEVLSLPEPDFTEE